jgi:phosphatidylserine/phosphatidylglycerophosphate/cardiolipin synthase-like enzyme
MTIVGGRHRRKMCSRQRGVLWMSGLRFAVRALSLLSFAASLCVPVHVAAQTTSPEPFPQSARFEVGFSPGGTAEALVVKVIDAATQSILCATYDFTSQPIAAALIRAAQRGVRVSVVADRHEADTRYSEITRLAHSGISIRLDGDYTTFHHKFLVVDALDVETGSFNYTYSAFERNAENVLVIWNAPDVADVFTAEWQLLWNQSTPSP